MLAMARRMLFEADKRLLGKLAWNMGVKGVLSVERFKRRLKHGSWRDRFQPRPRSAPGPIGEYARKRWL